RDLHAADSRFTRYHRRRDPERRQRGDRRERDRHEGCARRGGRRLRLPNRREARRVAHALGRATCLGAARDPLRGRRGERELAHAAVLLIGTPAAYLLARRRFRGRSVVLTLIELPLVLPPAVAGIALLAAFGRSGLLGGELDTLGVQIPFTQAAVVLAVAFVESPFYFRGAIAAFEAVDGP